MQEVEFVGRDVYLAGTTKKVGVIRPTYRGAISVRLNNGRQTYARYGRIYKGKFFAMCMHNTHCGNSCQGLKNPGCLYNLHNTHQGYYVDVDVDVDA